MKTAIWRRPSPQRLGCTIDARCLTLTVTPHALSTLIHPFDIFRALTSCCHTPQDMLAAEMHMPMLCAKQAAAVMKGVGGSVVFVANAGDRGLTDGAGNVGAISALTSSAAAAAGPDGVRVNCVTHTLGGGGDEGGGGALGHGTFSLATMRAPVAEDVAVQVRWGTDVFTESGCSWGNLRECD